MRPRLIYIGGYGRSGSTLTSRVLDQNPQVLNLGEMVNAARYFAPSNAKGKSKGRCTCGRQMADCPVWADIQRRVDVEPVYGVGAKAHCDLLQAAHDATGAAILLDSSKTPPARMFRPFVLHNTLPMELLLIHQIRDPRAVAWSHLRKRPDEPAPKRVMAALKVAASWALSNLACDLFRLRHPRRYVRLLYEHTLISGVPEGLHELVEPGPLLGRVLKDERGNHHAPAGNKMRRNDAITVRIDDEWRRAMPRYLKLAVLSVCFPQMLAYGCFSPPSPAANGRS